MENVDLDKRLRVVEDQLAASKGLYGAQLAYPLDDQTFKVLKDTMGDTILDVAWNDYFYYSSTFESIDRYFTTGVGTTSTTADGIVLTTGGAIGNSADLELYLTSEKTIDANRVSRFRTVAKVNTVTGQTTTLSTVNTDSGYVGFGTSGSTIQGKAYDGTTLSTITLGTATNDTYFKLELLYNPGENVIFYLNDVEIGSLSTNLPDRYDNTNMKIFTSYIENTTAATHSLTVEYFEFMQRRK